MSRYSLSHLSDPSLLHALHSLVAQDRATTADLLAHLAEVDVRKLYLPAAFPSMFAWCVGELRFSEDVALKRIQAARVARRFPAIFAMLADGRLHLSGVGLLAPCLTPENVDDLLGAAAGKRKAEIEELLAVRFPRSELLALAEEVSPGGVEQHAPEHVEQANGSSRSATTHAMPTTPPFRVTPTAPGRYALQVTIAKSTHEKLRHAQALLGHAVPAGEVAEVLDRALDALIRQIERRKFAATTRPGPHRPSVNPRHIPAEVRRAVWSRDGGRCTFVSAAGHRCPARTRLEFDHVQPVAQGGLATLTGIRLRCRAHNQYEAERAFGAGFMSRKREAASRRAAQRLAGRKAGPAEIARARATEEARARAAAAEEVVPWLRGLGLHADEARRAAASCKAIPDAPLEERVRRALSGLARPGRRPAWLAGARPAAGAGAGLPPP